MGTMDKLSNTPSPEHLARMKQEALKLLRSVAKIEGDSHFDDHLIEFRNDGWTVQHPISERIDGTLFDCEFNWDGGDIGYRGRYKLYHDELGNLNIELPEVAS